MTDNVVTHARFRLGPEVMENLRGLGVEVIHDFPPDETMGLKEPQYGETVLGTMTDEEYSVFVEIWQCQNEMTTMMKDITARKLHRAADLVATSDTPTDFIQNIKDDAQVIYQTPEEAQRSFYLQAKIAFLKGLLYWQLGEKYNCHEFKSGVRNKRRFVRKERRY